MAHWLSRYLSKFGDRLVIVHGAARGADSLASAWATRNGVKQDSYPAEWDKHGKAAGFIRNEKMWKVADAGIIFWDGESKGTKHSIKLASTYKKVLQVVGY